MKNHKYIYAVGFAGLGAVIGYPIGLFLTSLFFSLFESIFLESFGRDGMLATASFYAQIILIIIGAICGWKYGYKIGKKEEIENKISLNIKRQKIKIKWKGGLIIFLLVIATILLGSPGQIWEGLIAFCPILMLVLVLPTIFIISISLTLKKVKEGTYNTKWLLKINLFEFSVIAILMSLFLWGLIIIETYRPSGSDTSGAALGFFYIPIFVFLALVLFSIIPSLIYKKLIDKKRVLSIIFLAGLVLSISLIFLGIVYKASCDFYSYEVCVAKKAVKEENIDLCEKIKTPYNRSACYFGISYRGYKDMEICQRMQGPAYFTDCVINIAKNTEDEKLCYQLKGGDVDLCLMHLGKHLKNKDICNQIKEDIRRKECLGRVD